MKAVAMIQKRNRRFGEVRQWLAEMNNQTSAIKPILGLLKKR